MSHLHYIRTGDPANPTVLFLHGFMGDHRDWSDIIAGLSDRFDCVAVDLPGHGKSVGDGDAYDFDSGTASLIEVADAVGADSFSVVGYSMGGRVALYFSTLFAMRIDALVLESASPGLKTDAERASRRKHDEALACHLESQPFELFVDAWYAQPLFGEIHRYADRFVALRARRLEQDPHALAKNLVALGTGMQPPAWDDLAEHHIPTLLVVGERDAKFRGIADEMAALSPSFQIERVADCGHNVHFEAPERYTARLREFLSGHCA
jgi:2-succinyl-6-hydroxy-2,4-cyclohexadiene-1-carboxylate synthase